MVRVLVATTPAEGHVNVMAPVVEQLVARGHTVSWYTGGVYRQKVERAGATFLPIRRGYDYGGLTHDEAFPAHAGLTGTAGLVAVFRDIFLGTAADQLRDLSEAADVCAPDVVLTDETTYSGGFLAELRGLPLAWMATSIYTFSSRDTAPFGMGLAPSATPLGRLRNRFLHWYGSTVALRELRAAAAATRTAVGLAPLSGPPFENVVRGPQLYLLGTVPAFEYPRSDLRPQTRFVGPVFGAGAADAPFDPPPWWDELDDAATVVHLTQGTVANEPQRLLVPAVRALADLDGLVVVTTGVDPDRLDLGVLPSNVRLARFVPYHRLLPRADVLITNGGYGGVTAALVNDVPIVAAPASEDKDEVAAHVAWSGAGVHLPRRGPLEPRLRAAVHQVLGDPRFRARAAELGALYRAADGPGNAAELIAGLAGVRST